MHIRLNPNAKDMTRVSVSHINALLIILLANMNSHEMDIYVRVKAQGFYIRHSAWYLPS